MRLESADCTLNGGRSPDSVSGRTSPAGALARGVARARRGALAFGFGFPFPFAFPFAFGIVYSPAFAGVTSTR